MFTLGSQVLGLRPAAPIGDTFSSTRVGLDHISLQLGSMAELSATAQRLHEAAIEHDEVKKLTEFGLAILSFQDPDDINLELTAQIQQR
jgi:glyoxylase I family protein